jgi:predicted NACHT family NTPase
VALAINDAHPGLKAAIARILGGARSERRGPPSADEASPGRLVILGDPGYGKTVAALTLVKHINARNEPGAIVAELFPLAEWQRWRGEHPDSPFGHWLAEQLTVAHPSVEPQVAQELVDARLILPVLDGLDEIVAVEQRRACVAAIDAYAEHGAAHRPFVLTCRAREYHELAPDWVRDDECVLLVGLQPDQIQQRLCERTAGRRAWDVLRERQAAGDNRINELLASPLRLAIVLQVYRDGDPGELLEHGRARARTPVGDAARRQRRQLSKRDP